MRKFYPILAIALDKEDPDNTLRPLFQEVLFTKVGKVNAAISLTRRLCELSTQGIDPQDIFVLNAGSAGSSHFLKGTGVICDIVIQEDMDATPQGFKQYETPYDLERTVGYDISVQVSCPNDIPKSGIPTSLSELPDPKELTRKQCIQTFCFTGDSFRTSSTHSEYPHVVEMEAFALAKVCAEFGVGFAAIKYVSDGSGVDAPLEWETNAHRSAEILKPMAEQILEVEKMKHKTRMLTLQSHSILPSL